MRQLHPAPIANAAASPSAEAAPDSPHPAHLASISPATVSIQTVSSRSHTETVDTAPRAAGEETPGSLPERALLIDLHPLHLGGPFPSTEVRPAGPRSAPSTLRPTVPPPSPL